MGVSIVYKKNETMKAQLSTNIFDKYECHARHGVLESRVGLSASA
jgi:hypothetical protein